MRRQREWRCPFQNLVHAQLPHVNRLGNPHVLRTIRHLFVERATCGKTGHGSHVVAQGYPSATVPWRYAVCCVTYFSRYVDGRWGLQVAEGFEFDMPQFVLTRCEESL